MKCRPHFMHVHHGLVAGAFRATASARAHRQSFTAEDLSSGDTTLNAAPALESGFARHAGFSRAISAIWWLPGDSNPEPID